MSSVKQILYIELISPQPVPDECSLEGEISLQYGPTFSDIRIRATGGYLAKVHRTIMPDYIIYNLRRRGLEVRKDDEWYCVFELDNILWYQTLSYHK